LCPLDNTKDHLPDYLQSYVRCAWMRDLNPPQIQKFLYTCLINDVAFDVLFIKNIQFDLSMFASKSNAAYLRVMFLRVFPVMFLLIISSKPGIAGETLSFTAEHMIEAQMDARYMAFPEIETRADKKQTRFGLGYLSVTGDLMKSSAPMLSVQSYIPTSQDHRWGMIIGGFIDYIQFGGSTGNAQFIADFIDFAPFNQPQNVNVQSINGDALHTGISLSLTHRMSDNLAWQAGAALEYYSVNKFSIAFNTLDLASNFNAEVDYAANYHSITPYFSFRYFYPALSESYDFSSRFIMAWPLPRRGFKGRVSGPGFSVEGDTDEVGNGIHIPDPFVGVGFSIESRQHGWRVDVGASLWLYLAENKIHEGTDPPLFIHMNFPLK